MIRGAQVTVSTPTVLTVDNVEQRDAFGNPVPGTPTTETVDDVLIVPGGTSDLEAARPNGVSVSYTLHFPKTYTGSLEGCSVTLPAPYGGTYAVIGDPQPFMDANTPTRWNRAVEIGGAHG